MRQLLLIVILLFSTCVYGQWDETNYPSRNTSGYGYTLQEIKTDNTPKESRLKDTVRITENNRYILQQKTNQFILSKQPANYSHYHFVVTSGYSYRIAPIPTSLAPEATSRKKNLRSGAFVNASTIYFFNENVGAGAQYNLFKTNNEENDYPIKVGDQINMIEKIRDDVQIHYVGPVLSLRSTISQRKVFINCDLSLGYTLYKNNNAQDSQHYDISGNSFGFISAIGSDFMLNRNMSLGINFSIAAASINKIKVNNVVTSLKDDEIENLSRIGLGMVLRFYK